MTGTPIQNSLAEMWALFDFACQGKLLGTRDTFCRLFESVITRATDRDASDSEIAVGEARAQALRQTIEPFFLRRDKESLFGQHAAGEATESSHAFKNLTLQKKRDFIVWTRLSDAQQHMYRHFLESERVQALLNTTRSPLAALTVLKKICDHPDLLANYKSYQEELALDDAKQAVDDEDDSSTDALDTTLSQLQLVRAQLGSQLAQSDPVSLSGKLQLLLVLLKDMHESSHRCLIFSQSKMMLDIISSAISHYSFLRVDGSVTDPAIRQQRVDKFNKDSSVFCFLLTTQVGGVGLNLTGADRVIIVDPSWNPATDAQVCRAVCMKSL
jgi:SNF2 family DNA or RNA helicase